MICMKKVRFSSHPRANVGARGHRALLEHKLVNGVYRFVRVFPKQDIIIMSLSYLETLGNACPIELIC